jgi:hypothetical protein
MSVARTLRCLAVVLAAGVFVWLSGRALGIGFILGESKEELKLKYDLAATDHGTGRVTAVFTLEDEGRLKPLDEVQLVIPGEVKNADGSRRADLVTAIDMKDAGGGKRVGRVHILRPLAERGEIWLNTHTLDGQLDLDTRLHHIIPLAKYLPPPPPAKPGAK